MTELLHSRNQCGQTLLRLASRGSAILAELLRLAENIPEAFRMHTKELQTKYQYIILDFAYFNSIEYYDNKIDSSPDQQDLDEALREGHMELLTRFYKAFESVFKFVTDLIKFLEDVDEGVYIYQTLENILADKDGKQLMAEVLFMYGVMLLAVDMKIPGPIRERLIVAYQRYCGNEAELTNIEPVIKLFRSTGYLHHATAKRPANYPESYLARIEVPSTYVQMVISRLRTDDIYQMMTVYPEPEHRSAALATQAAMLFVILYFDPKTLHTEQAKMREIVDKHFPDNWVLNMYMGITVNLAAAWEPYKAARMALNNTLEPANVQAETQRHLGLLPKLHSALANYLKEGVLCEDFVLDNTAKLMRTMRKANVTLRWLMMHSYGDPTLAQNKRVQQLREDVLKLGYNAKAVFDLLLSTAQYEYLMKEMFLTLLAAKQGKWDALKKEASGRMTELSDVFGGVTPLTRVEVNEKLRDWFKSMASQIASLDYADSTAAGRKIVQLHQALEEVQTFHQVESSLQVRQFLKETQQSLQQMIRTINIKEEVLSVISDVADVSYAWQNIDSYTGFMQAGIKADPTLVIKLRATFLKLASAMELPLLRIHQAESPDLLSVSQFYSSELVTYVRQVLQIIPSSMFELLDQVIAIRTRELQEVPTRLDKERLKDFAQLDLRYKIAELTYQISVFTEGILMMKSTLVGVIKVDPKQLLEDGIRRELVNKVAGALNSYLVFEPIKGKPVELHERLRELEVKMQGFRRSFEYVQDYVDLAGLKIWQEEVSRIVNYNVEQECNAFLRTQVLDSQSLYQSRAIPIPRFRPTDAQSVNFIGRLARELLRLTSPQATTYLEHARAWYDLKTRTEVINKDSFSLLQRALGTYGLSGLDRLFCFMVVHRMQRIERTWNTVVKPAVGLLKELNKDLQPYTSHPANPQIYASGVARITKVSSLLAALVTEIGHIQLLRRMTATELNVAGKFDGKVLLGAITSLSDALLAEIEMHYRDPSRPFPGGDSLILPELAAYAEAVGHTDPLQKIYVTTNKMDELAVLLFFVTLAQLPRIVYSKAVGTLAARKAGDDVDGPDFVCGVITVLRQLHSTHQQSYQSMVAQYLRHTLLGYDPKTNQLPADAIIALAFLEEMASFSKVSRHTLQTQVPPYILDEFRKQVPT